MMFKTSMPSSCWPNPDEVTAGVSQMISIYCCWFLLYTSSSLVLLVNHPAINPSINHPETQENWTMAQAHPKMGMALCQGSTHQIPVVHNGIKARRYCVSTKGLDQEGQLAQAFLGSQASAPGPQQATGGVLG